VGFAFTGEIQNRSAGAIVVKDTCTTVAYALFNLQDRGHFFMGPGIRVYSKRTVHGEWRMVFFRSALCSMLSVLCSLRYALYLPGCEQKAIMTIARCFKENLR